MEVGGGTAGVLNGVVLVGMLGIGTADPCAVIGLMLVGVIVGG